MAGGRRETAENMIKSRVTKSKCIESKVIKRILIKRILRGSIGAVLAAVVSAGILAGCGSGSPAGTGQEKTSIDPDVVFRVIDSPMEKIPMSASEDAGEDDPGDMDSYTSPDDSDGLIRGITAVDGRYYVIYTVYGSEDGSWLCSFDKEGKNAQTLRVPSPENGWISGTGIQKDGSVIVLRSVYEEGSDSSEWHLSSLAPPEEASGDRGAEMTENWDQVVEADENFYVRNIICSDRYIVMLTENDLRIHSAGDGKELKKAGLPSAGFYGGICLNGEGDFILAGSGSGTGGSSAWKLDPEKGTFAEAKLSAEGFYNFDSISSGHSGYDFFGASEAGIFGFRLDGSEPVEIVDFIASDLSLNWVQGCALLSMDSAIVHSHTGSGGMSVELLKKADPSTVGEKTVLTLGCNYAEADLRKAVVNFNKSNDRYRINIQEYRYDEEGGNRLNTEIAAGNIPDLIDVSADMPVESYAAKGLFEDLEPMFSSDPDISGNAYLENVLDAFRIDGKMVFVTPDFGVIGMMGRKKDFGDSKGVKISDLERMIRDRNIGYDTALGLASRESVLYMVMYFATDQFVDWNSLTCSFDSDSFISLLRFTEKFPETLNYDAVDWEAQEALMLEGKQLVRDTYLYDFDTWMRERYVYIGEEASFMGYPGNGENGPVLQTTAMIAMSHATKEKEACWDFLRTLYLDEYQNNIEYGFPVSRKALLAEAEKAMQPRTYTYTDEEGKKVTEEIESSMFLNGKQIRMPRPQQKDIDEVMRILENAHARMMIDENISRIINEETGAFYAGQKTAEETADIIQSRVSVYIRETK